MRRDVTDQTQPGPDGGGTEADENRAGQGFTLATVAVVEEGGNLAAQVVHLKVSIEADDPADVAASLEVLGLSGDQVENLVARAVADGLGSRSEPRVEPVEIRAEGSGDERRWRIALGESGVVGDVPHMVVRTSSAAEVADRVLGLVTYRQLYRSAPARLHGGAVAREDGSTALVLGVSGAGKSTLTAHLVALGHELLTDEQVAVHPAQGVVAGFTRPMASKEGGTAYLPEPLGSELADATGTTLVPVSRLGGRHRLTGRPALVVLVGRDADATPGVEVLGPVQAAQALMDNNLDLVANPVDALSAFGWLVTTVPVVRVRYRTSAEGAQAVAELLAEPPSAPAGDWWVWPDTVSDTPSERRSSASDQRRAPSGSSASANSNSASCRRETARSATMTYASRAHALWPRGRLGA